MEELKEMGVQKMGKRLLVIKKLKALMNNGQSGQSDSGVEAEGESTFLLFLPILFGDLNLFLLILVVNFGQ